MAEIIHGAANIGTQTIYTPETSVAFLWVSVAVLAFVFVLQFIKACVGESAARKVASSGSQESEIVRENANGSYLFSGLLFLAALIATAYSIFVFYGEDTTAVDTGYAFWIAGGIVNVLLMIVYLLKPMYTLRSPMRNVTGPGIWALFAWVVVPFVMWNALFGVLFYIGPDAGVAVLIIVAGLTVLIIATMVYYAVAVNQQPSSGWVIAVGILMALFIIAYGVIVLLAPPVASVIDFNAVGIAYLVLISGNIFAMTLADFVVDIKYFNTATSGPAQYNNYPMNASGMYARTGVLRNPRGYGGSKHM